MYCYILSISLQLSGAIILLVFPNSISRANLIKTFTRNSFISVQGDSVEYNHNAYVDSCRTIYYNRIAFIYLICGYLVGIFANAPLEKRYIILIYVAVIFIILIIMAKGIVKFITTHTEKITKKLSREELEKLNIIPNIEFATDQEVREMFDDIF